MRLGPPNDNLGASKLLQFKDLVETFAIGITILLGLIQFKGQASLDRGAKIPLATVCTLHGRAISIEQAL